MNYKIATLRSFGGEFLMSLDNQYHLSINQYGEDVQGDYTVLIKRASKTYATHSEAKEAFGKLTICVLDGTYNFEDRARIAEIENIYVA